MKKINNCTLVCIDCYNYGKSIDAINKSVNKNEFDRVLFLTDIDVSIHGVDVVVINPIKSKEQYSYFVVKELYKYITTDFVLIIQHDGYTLNGEMFDEGLYDYDYAGALWLENDGYACGNGGYSWRSKKFLTVCGTDENIIATHPEDAQLCRTYRNYLEKVHGLKWATDEICEKFSFELRQPNQQTMGFHGFFHETFKPTIILKRSAALGDVVLIEPIARYYYSKGYNIVLDIPAPYFDLFNQHYFPIKHISRFDRGRIRPEKEINLDMAYEVKPTQNYLKSYFEFCGIKNYELRRPNLWPLVNNDTKLFSKYAVIHIDERETPERNVYGINWKVVERYLSAKGYTVVQIGKGKHDVCGTYINTPSIAFMKFVIAGCDLFIGVDSGPSHIAVGYNKPSIIFFGSVNPDCIHADLQNVEVIQSPCDKSFCWHTKVGGTSGVECFYKNTDKYLQCCKHDNDEIINSINKFIP